jgi:cation:H+ antiporter
MASTLVAGILIWDGHLSFVDGLILLSLLALFLIYTFVASKKGDHQEFDNLGADDVKQGQRGKVWLMLAISFVVLLVSAKLVVWGGSELAASFGVSDLLIGLTVVALGTSLPELAVSIGSALKKQHEMVVGNIIGSNLFNTVGVLAIPSLILPFDVPVDIINRDYPFMIALTILLFIVSYKFKKEGVISRLEGVLLLVVLAIYLYLLLWT